MRYYMKSKFFKIKEDFWIKNDYGEDAYFVDNKFLSFGLQFDLLKNNRLLYSVKEKLFTFMSNYEILEDGNIIAQISQKFTFFKDNLRVSSKYGDLVIKGDYFDYNYDIYKNGKQIAKIQKEIFSFTDNYYIDIDFEDEGFILALVVIIDNIIDKQNK